MGEATKIQWTDHTFNPWRGCAKVHAGCTNCYAEKNVGVKLQGVTWGEAWQGGVRTVAADSTWRHPLKWARDAARDGVRRRVFCASLADVLEVPASAPEYLRDNTTARRVADARDRLALARGRLWDTIRQTAFVCSNEGAGGCLRPVEAMDAGECADCGGKAGGLDWLLLTKRPENWELVPEDVRQFIWLGTSISDQRTADEWGGRIVRARGFRHLFFSLEPMVAPVDPSRFLMSSDGFVDLGDGRGPVHRDDGGNGIDWVIVGGESGTKARPCHVEWVRDVVRQCRAAGVPVFVKQLGSDPRVDLRNASGLGPASFPLDPMDSKGGDMAEWPEDLRVRELPGQQ